MLNRSGDLRDYLYLNNFVEGLRNSVILSVIYHSQNPNHLDSNHKLVHIASPAEYTALLLQLAQNRPTDFFQF
jgi:hypothetical protein